MTSKIKRTSLYLSTTKVIRDNLHQTYYRARDVAQLYELKLKMINVRQREKIDRLYKRVDSIVIRV